MNVSHSVHFLICFFVGLTTLDGKDFEKGNFELLQQFETFLKNRKQNNDTNSTPKKKTIDKNFELIDNFKDKINKILESHPDILTKRPEDFKLAIDCLAKSISERKNLLQDKDIAEATEKSISEIAKQYEEIIANIQGIIILLRCTDLILNEGNIMGLLKQHNNAGPLTSNDATNLLNKLAPMTKYLPDTAKSMITSIFIDASKTKFEERPNIPSYYTFQLLKNIYDALKKIENNMNKTTFNRSFENAIFSMKKLLSDLENLTKSDQIAKNIIPFYEGAKKNLILQMDFIQKREKEWKEYLATLELISKQIKGAIKEIIEAKKDQTIFDTLTEE